MAAIVYWGIAMGFREASGKFWASFLWPFHLGKMIAQEAAKRGIK